MLRNLFGARKPAAETKNIRVNELKQRLDAGERFYLLDVRSAEEYSGDGHIAGSHLLPLPMLATRQSELPRDLPIVCICRSGNRSGVAAEQLARQGFSEVINLTGGMIAWAQAGLPMKQG
ncbi:rhodanese-like domain-containing protein [Candidatus Viridilinea mediisalina]|uniref:Sulfurtransferase n=1 Tax=Candidatus Viridilinea mediisalina TaxID=2024553 RepID=A0A2A6RJP4_9CHLR|nr:rhodanese-like domain-containing protein [Candidatus Viridilinea mediisalina]PDW03115.1 sulfurtransferase [Candidatus Viridilinea mediisalina]